MLAKVAGKDTRTVVIANENGPRLWVARAGLDGGGIVRGPGWSPEGAMCPSATT